jgi:hypothetical protein
LLTVVFAACARLTALFAAALGLRRAPAAETVRKALLANLPELELLERRCHRALRASLSKLGRRRQRLAIDLTLLPYHGQPCHDADERYRGQVQSGTTHFHAYATAYLKGPGGTRVFACGKRSGFSQHRLTEPDGRTATVGICVHGRNRRGRRGKHDRERLVYAYGGWSPPWPGRDRNPLPAAEPSAGADVYTQSGGAAVPGGGGLVVA